jgi:hypothetical protein
MFRRKRKDEPDNLGLSAPFVEPAVVTTPTTEPAAPAPTPTPEPASLPATPQAMMAEILGGHGPVGQLLAQIKADPEGFKARVQAQAKAAGVSTFVLTSGGLQQIGGTPGAVPAPEPKHVDVVEELTKAADLHDKGALTDDEFETLKKKLLGQ